MTAVARHVVWADLPLPKPTSTDPDGGAVWSLDGAVGTYVYLDRGNHVVASPGRLPLDAREARRFALAVLAAVDLAEIELREL